ncbi:hypothetical protein [Pseudoxanthomonas yeongjuensis]|uniref:hypothetical protein n=1 Tax=Pseudoxanthomonas yeongjuensis TaxID=377616 RepID=UPI001391BDF4|nr:hypothetical protein [Pseudoxanthomonas yeongjuensis]
MSSYLNHLVGMSVTAVDEADDSMWLRFDGCSFRSFTKHICSVPLGSLVGNSAKSVSLIPDQGLAIHFSNGGSLSVSLAPEHYTGPEAFVAQFLDGTCVVQ